MSSYLSDYDFTQIPFDRIESLGQRSLLYRDLFAVSWILGRYCNYHCSYCWPYASTKTKDHRPTEVVIRNIEEIKRQARARGFNSFHFSFSGGEPSLHPGYLEFLKVYGDDTPHCNYQSVHMTSNLSQPMNWYEKYVAATAQLNRVSITASFHSEFAKPEAFRDKILFLQSHDVQVTINMVMVPERFDLLWERALFFHQAGINVTLKPQSNTDASQIVDGYTEEQLEILKKGLPQMDYTGLRLKQLQKVSERPRPKHQIQDRSFSGVQYANMQMELRDSDGQVWYLDQAERLNAFPFNRFSGWDCSAGYRSLVIREPGGVVKRSYSCHDKLLGTLDEGFQLFDDVRPCTTPSCVSSADSKIPKRKPTSAVPLWPSTQS
ncbi:radical SAM protein [Bdellovibrio sp. HCB2-146]|uniref:radical SAM protein n=1 Tax=Bdellovibrio sp. HCB2-146 TaxID=3394362 RepID=UPI0039BC5A46